MALSINNREVEELARELARLQRKPITEALRDSLRREVARARVVAMARPDEDEIVERVMEIARRCAARPDITTMTDDEILGYDEFGAPTR